MLSRRVQNENVFSNIQPSGHCPSARRASEQNFFQHHTKEVIVALLIHNRVISVTLKEHTDMSSSTGDNANESKSTNIVWHDQAVSQTARWGLNQHKGCVVWFTGLSGAGKSSVANQVEVLLNQNGIRTYLLDGDNIRHGLCKDLTFSTADRAENIRRVGQVAKLLADAGVVILTALISPYRADRDMVRGSVEEISSFYEIHVKASLSTCEARDPKGLYKLARDGKIKNFTGIDDPYEEPLQPELVLDSDSKSIEELASSMVEWLGPKIKLNP